ncbi:hypothetical protein J3B02_000969 [Coemansia erecta]|uniref:Peptidase S1 domain-containing protein n=1 Tax=Coemansia asiatica TaxID=1052880 RepID=A0A9W7XGC7_9FUNG|nr:hypothetical protein LPJ64_005890 [Coemansia asiatica]KAJ2857477.1 hypothetical protein J3B02_000969 [Coemansia erecta]KAJ2881882.1 hypothetical protein FB639_002517 [Coemansia asiatica]
MSIGKTASNADPLKAMQQSVGGFSSRITNGTIVAQGDGSAFVKILIDFGQAYGLCGGTIIDPTVVVTASHCVFEGKDGDIVSPKSIYIFYGDVVANSNYVQPTNIYSHPEYNRRTQHNDIAVLRIPRLTLKKGFTETLPLFNGLIEPAQPMHIFGWGITRTHGTVNDSPPSLLTQTVYISYPDDCKLIEQDYKSANGPQICVNNNYNVGVDVCSADSGTGTTIVGTDSKQYLAGLVSYGTNAKGEFTCGERGSFGIYTNVPHYLQWIESITGVKLATGPYSSSMTDAPKPTASTSVSPQPQPTSTHSPTCYFYFICF